MESYLLVSNLNGSQTPVGNVAPYYNTTARAWVTAGGNFAGAESDYTVQTVPAAVLPYPPALSALAYFNAFAIGEELAIEGSADPVVQKIYGRLQMAISAGATLDPNGVPVQTALAYLSEAPQTPNAGVGVYLSGALAPVPAWKASAAYAVGASVAVGNLVYTATTAGTSAATGTGPSGEGSTTDDGSVVWAFTPTPYVLPSRVAAICHGVAQ